MAPIHARLRRRAVSVGLALLVGVAGLSWPADGGGSDLSSHSASTVSIAAADYDAPKSGDDPELGQAAAEAKKTIKDANDRQKTPKSERFNIEGAEKRIDTLVARAKDNPDLSNDEFSKADLAKALKDLSDMLKTMAIDSQSRGALGSKVLKATNRHGLAEAMAEVRATKQVADSEATEGTKVYAGIGAMSGRQIVDFGDGTIADFTAINDADIAFKGKDGDIHAVEVKNTGQATTKADVAAQAKNLANWQKASPGRKARYQIETQQGWDKVFNKFKKDKTGHPAGSPAEAFAEGNLDLRVAGQRISPQQLKEMNDAWNKKTGAEKKAALDSGKMKDPATAMKYLKNGAQEDNAVEAAVEAANRILGMTNPCPEGNGSQDLNIAAFSKTAPCGGDESGLSTALSSPTYGGVDFSTLQLRYLSDTGSGMQYAFSAKAAQKELEQDPGSGLSTLVKSMADLRTWLVLSPNKFWVNLNPNEPDRIIDKDLGQTDAGRALLEADWHMKQTQGKLLDPNTSFGAAYWRRLGGSGGQSCYSSRMWIVPGDVEVRQDGSSLYVLKANLNVKAKAESVAGLGQTTCNSDPQQTARNAQVEQEMVVPKIEKEVNSAPEYAPLRQAFLARVVAQWLLDRHAAGHATSFDSLIGSGNLGPAAQHGSWRPQQVYDAYVRSIRNGTFTYRRTEHVGNTTLTYVIRTGGVDFSKLTSTQLSGADMNRKVPGLPQTIARSTNRPATAADGSIWLGDTAKAPSVSSWDHVRSFLLSRTGLFVLLGVALLALLFFVRDGSALRRRRVLGGGGPRGDG